jgi:hypothetical protein
MSGHTGSNDISFMFLTCIVSESISGQTDRQTFEYYYIDNGIIRVDIIERVANREAAYLRDGSSITRNNFYQCLTDIILINT